MFRKIAGFCFVAALASHAQLITFIDFDTAGNWTAGSGALNTYQSDHVYSEGGWRFTGGRAMRQGTSMVDGFSGALGSRSWRLDDGSAVPWTAICTFALAEGERFTSFGFQARRWDGTPSPSFAVDYSFDGGASWAGFTNINNAALGNSSNWATFSCAVESPDALAANQFVVRFSDSVGERIMVDGFVSEVGSDHYREGIHIIHVNDVHSRLTPHDYDIPGTNDAPVLEKVGGAAYAATKMLELKAAHPGSLVIDAGDTSEGSILGDLRSNGGLIDFYQELDRKLEALGGRGLDASVVGNHDVRYAEMLTNMRACTNFPFISMNIIEFATGEPYFEPYVTVEADGKRVGILGYTTDTSSHLGPETATLVRVAKCGWDEGEILVKDYVDHLRNVERCDVVVMIVHVGHSRVATDSGDNPQLVKDDGETKPPEVVVGGHWHTMAWTVWQPAILNHKTVIAEAASYLQFIGTIELEDDGTYVGSQKHVVRCADIVPDPDIEAVIDGLVVEYNASSNKVYDLDEVIGHSSVDLRLNKNKWWSHNEFPWAGDNTAGAWIADAMQWYVETQTSNRCDLALQSGGGVRRDNAAGAITFLEIYETYPWQDDNMVLIDAKGSEIWSFIQADYVGTSISKGWKVFAHDGIISNITFNGADIDLSATYQVAVSDYMYTFDNDFTPGGWSDPVAVALDNSIRQSIIDYTSQFDEANPMDVPGPRYILNTGHSGRFRAVITMVDDSDDYGTRQPHHESAYVRLLDATPDTVARRGGYVDETLVNVDGSINPLHRFSEGMLYRSYLGFEEGALVPGTILNIGVESGFHDGNPQWVEQAGILANGVEFDIVGTNTALALPAFKGSIVEFWDEWHENHYVVFECEKTAADTVADRLGMEVEVYTEGGYDAFNLPGTEGDMFRLSGLQTMHGNERRFRCAEAVVVGAVDYTPVSSVDPIFPLLQTNAQITLVATATDSVVPTHALLPAIADADVEDGNPDMNNGAAENLYVQSASTNASFYGDERIWLKFDLSGIPAGATIDSATLKLYCWGNFEATANLPADVHSCSDDSWTETGISWNTQPVPGGVLDTEILDVGTVDVWYGWDVTPFAASQAAGDAIASFMLKPQMEDSATANAYAFDSREYQSGAMAPTLEVGFSGVAPIGGTVTNLDFHYAYSADGLTWGSPVLMGSLSAAPWSMDFGYPEGHGWYAFHTVATDDQGNVEPAPLLPDARVHFSNDYDGDGLADFWELLYYGSLTNANASSDSDGDGFIDLHEFLAGTNPTNAADLLAVELEPGTNQVTIIWPSVENKTYSIQRTEDLTTGFTNLAAGIEATPPENSVTDAVESVETRFYRIRLEE